jgi:Ca2+-transporting ATPase
MSTNRSVSVPTSPARCWALSPEHVLEALETDAEVGLSADAVRRRRLHYGPNRLRETLRRGAWRMLWDQLASPIVALLGAAALVALAFDEQLEAVAIGAVLVLNTAIGFLTERRAIRSMEALRELGRVNATVRRSGAAAVVPAEELVPGDIVLLEAGDVLTADLRLAAASRMQADESTLTGESVPVDKSIEACPDEAPLPDRSSMLFKGTALTRGHGEGVVVATGMATELGGISQLVEQAEAEATPLETRLDRLGRRLILLTLAIAALVALSGIASGRDLYLSIEIALALAVAAVPEGLPIVATVALARGMWRMARRHALVEQLSAVETLGSTSVILADKTGTLTENRMAVAELALADGSIVAVAPENAGRARFTQDGVDLDLDASPLLRSALRVGALCNNAALAGDGSENAAVGDPTELALLFAARAGGLEREALVEAAPQVAEVAFDSEAKRMATLHREPDALFVAIKGAPETVIPDCTRVATGERSQRELDAAGRAEWLARANDMAARGQRLLALATAQAGDPTDFRYESMTLLALVGLYDPPRAGVREAIEACQDAGIRVVMVTGDHGATAWNIAAATGLIAPAEGEAPASLDARSLPHFDGLPEEQTRALLQTPVIARSTPRQKLELIALHQRHGAIVAMTGDGVNDAPALRKADIGVAMGQRGTQVAREAADMVLEDDEFSTIVAAVAQGRAIFSNIRKFVLYLMSCNVSEIAAVTVATIAQGPLPLLPLQILFLNLVTDVFPALALGVGEGSPTLMRAPPRPSDEPMVGRRHWSFIFVHGAVIAASVFAALLLAIGWLGKTDAEATTISFLTLALAQLWHVFNMRERDSHGWRNEITRNRWVWGALLLCVALLVLAVRWTPLARVLSVADPGTDGWSFALAMSLLPLLFGQLALVLQRRAELTRVDAPDRRAPPPPAPTRDA